MPNLNSSFRVTHDSITSTLGRILNQTKQVQSASEQAQQAFNKLWAVGDKPAAINSLNNFITLEQQARKAASDTNNELGRSENYLSNIQGLGFDLVNFTAAYHWVRRIANTFSELVNTADNLRTIEYRLDLFNESEFSSGALLNGVYQVAQATRSELEATGDLVNQILASGVISGENAAVGALRIVELLNQATVAGGSSAQATQQFIRALSFGQLNGQQLRGLINQAPYLANVLAQGLARINPEYDNLSTADLKNLVNDGVFTAETIVNAFLAMEDEIEMAFNRIPRTAAQAFQTARNQFKYFLRGLLEDGRALNRLSDLIWSIVDALSSDTGQRFFDGVAQAIEVVTFAAELAVGAIGNVITYIVNNGQVVMSVLTAIGILLTANLLKAIATFVILNWRVLLVVAALSVLAKAAIDAGATMGDIFGGVIAVVGALATIVYDLVSIILGAITMFVSLIWDLSVTITLIFGTIGVAVYEAGGYIVDAFTTAFSAASEAVIAFGDLAQGVISKIWGGITDLTGRLGAAVTNSGISGYYDGEVFITDNLGAQERADLANAILEDSAMKQRVAQDRSAEAFERAAEHWNNAVSMDVESPQFDKLNKAVDDITDLYVNPIDAFDIGGDILGLKNPFDAFQSGLAAGERLDDILANIGDRLPDFEDIGSALENLDFSSISINGGYLDDIKNGSVDLNNQTIRLLRDMRADDIRRGIYNYEITVVQEIGTVRNEQYIDETGKFFNLFDELVDSYLER